MQVKFGGIGLPRNGRSPDQPARRGKIAPVAAHSVLDRFGQCHATGPAFERLQFGQSAEARRDAGELHRAAAVRAKRRVGARRHSLLFAIELDRICLDVHQGPRIVHGSLSAATSRNRPWRFCRRRSAFERLQVGNDVGDLARIELKCRHSGMAGANSLGQRLLPGSRPDTVRCNVRKAGAIVQRALADLVDGVTAAAIRLDEGAASLGAGGYLRVRRAGTNSIAERSDRGNH